MARLCFDYGHGGDDPGAVYLGRKESDDVLSLGMEVARDIRRHGVTVDETRTSDANVTLRARTDLESKQEYDYFISFHRNAFMKETASGAETYVFTEASEKSKALAFKLQAALVDVGFANRGVKTANFHVLRESEAPAVLIEIGFIDNSNDNNLFDSKRAEIVRGISKAILSQLGTIYIEETESEQPNDPLTDALNILVKNGIISSPEYWQENARSGKTIKGEYAALLIERMGAFILTKLPST
ncbi:N-acetylmuramoyl-L-alanine amidase family protein [Pelotomaculum propionicicum]|uniref:N-acetylmuramoyl-L-alanine amidase family protein n=1 Tax=Pelotomaculum propionicicum TaxID=258475 RepID=UPI003B7D7686